MNRLSIVVPVQADDISAFEDTLASVLRNRPARTQIVVMHDGSYPDPHDLHSMGVHVVHVAGALGYDELFFASLSHCSAGVVHWLRPGVTVDEGWCESAIDQFDNPQVASVTPLLVSEKHPDRVLTAGITCDRGYRVKLVGTGSRFAGNARWTPLGPAAWAAFYRRSCLRMVAGALTPLAGANGDLEIALSFRAVGWLNVLDPNSVVTMERPEMLVRDYQAVSGSQSQRILWRHHPGSLGESLQTSLSAVLTEVIAGLVSPRRGWHGLQRLLATTQIGDRARHRATLAALRQIQAKSVASRDSAERSAA